MLPSDAGRGAQMLDEGLDAVAEALAPGVTEDPLLMRRHASGTGAVACVGGLSSAPPPSPVASSVTTLNGHIIKIRVQRMKLSLPKVCGRFVTKDQCQWLHPFEAMSMSHDASRLIA